MPHYAVRITYSYEDIKSVIHRWAMECDKMAVFEHIGSKKKKKHIHIAIYNSRVLSKTLRSQGQKQTHLSLAGNGNCSMKAWEPTEDHREDIYMYYMTKGKHNASYLKGYTQEDVEIWKSKWVEPPEKVEKLSQVKQVYDEQFTYEIVNREWKEYNIANADSPVSLNLFVRRKAHKASMKINKMMITPKCSTDARTLYLTYVYQNGIKLDKNDPYTKYVSWERTETNKDPSLD